MSGFIFFFLICDNVKKYKCTILLKGPDKPLYFDENRFANIVIIYDPVDLHSFVTTQCF